MLVMRVLYYLVVSDSRSLQLLPLLQFGYIEIHKLLGKHLSTTILTVAADEKTYNNLWVKTSSFILGRPSIRNME